MLVVVLIGLRPKHIETRKHLVDNIVELLTILSFYTINMLEEPLLLRFFRIAVVVLDALFQTDFRLREPDQAVGLVPHVRAEPNQGQTSQDTYDCSSMNSWSFVISLKIRFT